jgi:hypothetical protein
MKPGSPFHRSSGVAALAACGVAFAAACNSAPSGATDPATSATKTPQVLPVSAVPASAQTTAQTGITHWDTYLMPSQRGGALVVGWDAQNKVVSSVRTTLSQDKKTASLRLGKLDGKEGTIVIDEAGKVAPMQLSSRAVQQLQKLGSLAGDSRNLEKEAYSCDASTWFEYAGSALAAVGGCATYAGAGEGGAVISLACLGNLVIAGGEFIAVVKCNGEDVEIEGVPTNNPNNSSESKIVVCPDGPDAPCDDYITRGSVGNYVEVCTDDGICANYDDSPGSVTLGPVVLGDVPCPSNMTFQPDPTGESNDIGCVNSCGTGYVNAIVAQVTQTDYPEGVYPAPLTIPAGSQANGGNCISMCAQGPYQPATLVWQGQAISTYTCAGYYPKTLTLAIAAAEANGGSSSSSGGAPSNGNPPTGTSGGGDDPGGGSCGLCGDCNSPSCTGDDDY